MWRCCARLPNVSCLFLKFFDDCSSGGRRLSLRNTAIIRELNETVFANKKMTLFFLNRAKRWSAPYCTPDLASLALHRLHSVISDFRPPSVSGSGEAALRRLVASRAIGGYSLASDDPARRSRTVFQSSRVARP